MVGISTRFNLRCVRQTGDKKVFALRATFNSYKSHGDRKLDTSSVSSRPVSGGNFSPGIKKFPRILHVGKGPMIPHLEVGATSNLSPCPPLDFCALCPPLMASDSEPKKVGGNFFELQMLIGEF
jgi:hypothetical protein